MPLTFWAAQTKAASTLLGVGTPYFTSYISPTSAATTIQQAYRSHLTQRNNQNATIIQKAYRLYLPRRNRATTPPPTTDVHTIDSLAQLLIDMDRRQQESNQRRLTNLDNWIARLDSTFWKSAIE